MKTRPHFEVNAENLGRFAIYIEARLGFFIICVLSPSLFLRYLAIKIPYAQLRWTIMQLLNPI